MEQSPRLNLSYVAPSQAQKHVTVNESFRRLDALVQLTIRSRSISAEPPSPAEGDAYILPSAPSGPSWDHLPENAIAVFQDGVWSEILPVEGLRAWIADEGALLVCDGAAWSVVSGAQTSAAEFGVNTQADATNRLAVKSDAILFSHDDVTPGNGNCLLKVNKEAAADTASFIFQAAFSGRAEIGLLGNNNFTFKVSDDGSTFYEGIKIEQATTFGISDLMHVYIGPVSTYSNPATLHVEEDNVLSAIFVNTEDAGASEGAGLIGACKNNPDGADHRLGFLLFGSRGGAQNNYNNAGMEAFSNAAWSGSDRSTYLAFSVTPSGSTTLTEAVRIIENGNVGVGLTAPSAKLDVEGAVKVKAYAVAGVPSASTNGAGAIIYVSNETGGAVLAFSDGADWRRVTDRAVIS